jgi:hypothetical protein
VDSGFARGSFEALAWHLPKGRFDGFGFVNGEYTRFFRRTTDFFGTVVDHEAMAFAGGELRFRQSERLTATLDLQAYHLDQIFDISDTSVLRAIEALKLDGAKVIPGLRLGIWRQFWIEGSASGELQKFQDGFNDARLGEWTGRLGWGKAERLEIAVSATERRRRFLRRHEETARGTSLDLFGINEHELGATVRAAIGASRHWKTLSRAAVLEYHDIGTQTLNYRQNALRQEIEWSAGRWLVRATGEYRHRRYANQTVGEGLTPEATFRDETSASLRLERKLSERWTAFAEAAAERSRSNDELAAYRTREGLLGLRWNWEK